MMYFPKFDFEAVAVLPVAFEHWRRSRIGGMIARRSAATCLRVLFVSFRHEASRSHSA